MEILVRCRQCGKDAKQDEMKLDPDFGMVVCRHCIETKPTQGKSVQPKEEDALSTPRLRDPDFNARIKGMPNVEVISEDVVKYQCPDCNYLFKYSLAKQYPNLCPMCGSRIKEFKL